MNANLVPGGIEEHRHRFLGGTVTYRRHAKKGRPLLIMAREAVLLLHAIPSYIKTEISYISILHDIVLALQTYKSFFLGGLFIATVNQVIIRYDFGTDKTAFNIRVDFAGGFLCFRAVDNRPGPDFISSGCEEINQAQQSVLALINFASPASGSPSSSKNTAASSSGSSAISDSIFAETATTWAFSCLANSLSLAT